MTHRLKIQISRYLYYREWRKVLVPPRKPTEDATKRLELIPDECCAGELADIVREAAPEFVAHSLIKRWQSQTFKRDLDIAKESDDTVVVQFDYAMQYNCEFQKEVCPVESIY